ncbi:flagellar hook-associated protein FlgL [Gallaecimonas kandeliae]|uniref:flagellar hook-associated protein FlgL n=1 Tax=Gallaecimonas kandeliae TaxID=3029055 RepID=UPI0026484E05|nr:flagellar hook-associated protein FlgL [Gallaecimonas kandeliae]WKE66716.1 flagellar hook-associated protein FlgL [Gallaecimonas kandeliae]
MRVSTQMIFQSGLTSILGSQESLVKLRDQVSTQQRILQPSDDPAGAGTVLRLNEQLTTSEQYRNNGDSLKSRLGIAETTLSGMTDTLNSIRTLLVQANNGTNGPDDRDALAQQLEGLRDQLMDAMNTRDANGDYIFSGNEGGTPPYQLINGSYVYQGDQGKQQVQVAGAVAIDANFPGYDLFDNLAPTLSAVGTLTAGAGTVSTQVVDSGQFEAFYRANYDPNNAPGNTFSVTTVAGAPDSYQVTDSGGTVLASGNYVPGQAINFNGMDITLSGAAGAAADITLQPPVKDNILNALTSYAASLRDNSLTPDQRQAAAAAVQGGAQQTYDSVVGGQATIGGRVNVIDTLQSAAEAAEVNTKQTRADIAEVDIGEAVSKLAQQQTVMQAAYSGFHLVNSLSLFNYVN